MSIKAANQKSCDHYLIHLLSVRCRASCQAFIHSGLDILYAEHTADIGKDVLTLQGRHADSRANNVSRVQINVHSESSGVGIEAVIQCSNSLLHVSRFSPTRNHLKPWSKNAMCISISVSLFVSRHTASYNVTVIICRIDLDNLVWRDISYRC